MFARPGTITAIVGPNGAGKSSLFLAMMGALKTSGSKVSLLGKSLDALGPTALALSLRPEKEMPRRRPGHFFSSLPPGSGRLARLGQLLHQHVPLQPGQMVDEQHALQMVHLMLETGGQQPFQPLLMEIGREHV